MGGGGGWIRLKKGAFFQVIKLKGKTGRALNTMFRPSKWLERLRLHGINLLHSFYFSSLSFKQKRG